MKPLDSDLNQGSPNSETNCVNLVLCVFSIKNGNHFYLMIEDSLPIIEYDFQLDPKTQIAQNYIATTSFSCVREDIALCDIIHAGSLYIIYSILCPYTTKINGRWAPIQEIFNEETNFFVKKVISQAISYI